MKEGIYKVSDFKKLISESSNEFKAKLGPDVEKKDKEINGKAYSDAKKRAHDYDGGLAKEGGDKKAKYEKVDGNKTTLDYNPKNVTPEYKKRVHAQVKGYTSELEMNNKIEKSGDFSDGENIYKGIKDAGKKMKDNEKSFKRTGLQAREMPADVFDKEDMYENTIKTVHFKKTTFLTEGHMMSRIPDDFKRNGTKFRMKDATGNEYLLEWADGRANILEHSNKQGAEESIARMKELMGYKTSDSNTTVSTRLNENDSKFEETLNKMRKIIK